MAVSLRQHDALRRSFRRGDYSTMPGVQVVTVHALIRRGLVRVEPDGMYKERYRITERGRRLIA